MMSKYEGHTPGPWYNQWTTVVAADGSPIADCEVRRSTEPDGGDHALDREIEANARLIASVPDLLADRERLLRILSEIVDSIDCAITDGEIVSDGEILGTLVPLCESAVETLQESGYERGR